jgi:hypothetical protein
MYGLVVDAYGKDFKVKYRGNIHAKAAWA